MTAQRHPPDRPEAIHLDPDPLYVDERYTHTDRLGRAHVTFSVRPRTKPGVSRGVLGWLFIVVLLALVTIAAGLLATPRSAQDRDLTVPTPGLTGASQSLVEDRPPAVGAPLAATRWAGTATWYCGNGSRCTRGYPASGLYAAAGPALRVGDWRGRIVTVRSGTRTVRVRLIDWCSCGGGRVIDLYRSAFSRLASPSRGVIRVSVSWDDGAPATLPPTNTEVSP